MISLTYIMIDLCFLCVSVVSSTPSSAGLYLRIHFTHQIQESQISPQSLRWSALFEGKKA
ncbi:MAG: hypothetical protein RPG89_10975 [Microcystis panniformis WG22]|nr:hypothetical protein [Microcystis aeruginosa]MDB9506685.1 hypothetical protein [Microcystis aeruginosa CS-338/01]MDY7049111.1 hypothetical protein [Microcystis panniformis WG22]